PQWDVFCALVGDAAYWAKRRGKRTVLGGMSPIDPGWLDLLASRGTLRDVDVVGVHGFPGTWETAWAGWDANVARVREVLDRHGLAREVWITEVGFSTRRDDAHGQLRAL